MMIYERILRDFKKEKVEYVVTGGIAFNLLGGLRNTLDLDLLVELTDSNLKKIVNILKKRGYKIKQPVDPMGIADKKTRESWIKEKNLKALNFYGTENLEEIDLMLDSPVNYERARRNSRNIAAHGLSIRVISIDDLIEMKRAAGRSVDRYDIDELMKIKRIKGKK